MKDRDVRIALRRKVFADHIRDPGTLVVEELGVAHGDARVDVAVVNGRLHGFEIKSDADTLKRLPAQIEAYGAVFDRVTLVVGSRHLEGIWTLIPDWWGVKVATMGIRGAVHFDERRAPRNNPAVCAVSVARLLWRDEAMSILLAQGLKGAKSKNKAQLYEMMACNLTLEQIRTEVRICLKARAGWRSDAVSVPDAGSSPLCATS